MIVSEATLLTLVGLVGGGLGSVLVYFLKSRCTEVECCCVKCKRDVLKEVSATLSPPKNNIDNKV
jgi:tryptophanyl-tRNA synthetase